MNKLVKRGLSAYKIFLKNKIVASLMMLFSGIMMFIAALNGHGNDTLTLPIIITSVGAVLTFWAGCKLGYLKSAFDHKEQGKKAIVVQVVELIVYLIVLGLGVFLLANQSFTDKVLNLMAGFFTILNGIFGLVNIFKNLQTKDFRWKLTGVMTALEFALGIYFIISSDSIDISGYTVMGALTTVAGLIEVLSAVTIKNLKSTFSDGKEIVHIMKNGKTEEE